MFLGLVEDTGNAIIVGDENFIDANGQQAFQEKMNAMRLPYDVGRLPRTMLNYFRTSLSLAGRRGICV